MITDLAPFIVFLHGLSGSGKGEVQLQLGKQCEAHGYSMHYAASGDLFRAALADPTIAEQMRQGLYIDTLGAIMPGLKAAYEQFLDAWLISAGRALLVLDGVIRRDAFTNAVGELIPSQIQQIAVSLYEVHAQLHDRPTDAVQRLIGPVEDPEPDHGVSLSVDLIQAAWHVLLDVRPADAEHQMRQRAIKELDRIRQQLTPSPALPKLSPSERNLLKQAVDRLDDLLHGSLMQHDEDEDVSVMFADAEGTIPQVLHDPLSGQVDKLRQELAEALHLPVANSFAKLFKARGIETNLRDDDISPIGRNTRVHNFMEVKDGPNGPVYTPGFAAQALLNGLGFALEPDGSFASQTDNCIVIPNGARRGIDLESLRLVCDQQAKHILKQAESSRISLM